MLKCSISLGSYLCVNVRNEEGKIMFYRFIRAVSRIIVFILNGKVHTVNKEKLPQEQNYILVGPHKTWWDPIFFALAASPKCFGFMAKEELFKNPILRFILTHANAFPVNRDNPGPSALKTPVNMLKKTHLSLIMFPSGTRSSDELKGGVAVIAKLAKVPIVPAVYEGPETFKELLKRKKSTIYFGDPIDISDIKKMDKQGIEEVSQRLQRSFDDVKNVCINEGA